MEIVLIGTVSGKIGLKTKTFPKLLYLLSNLTAIFRKKESSITGSLRVDIIKPEEPAVSFSGIQLEGWVAGAFSSTLDTIQTILRAPLTPVIPKCLAFLILAEELGRRIKHNNVNSILCFINIAHSML